MGKVYKIHPAIGVARVGDKTAPFFIGPEKPSSPGVEIAADGTETPIAGYKAAGRIKRQAARFRVFEYERDGAGNDTAGREITAAEAAIEWRVELVNRKAALDHTIGTDDEPHPAEPRNTGVTGPARAGLVIRDPAVRTISGLGSSGVEFNGAFLTIPVYLGELRTDKSGRLLVLGGEGKSASPDNRPLADFANNDGWHDDVADGPVTATLTFLNSPPRQVEAPAWVTVAPPDFAPEVGPIVTLYDVAFQAAIDAGLLAAEPATSFTRHIQPVLRRASGLRWTNQFLHWNGISRDYAVLSDTSPGASAARAGAAAAVMNANLLNAVIPSFMRAHFDAFVAGTFQPDLSVPPADTQTVPELLDRAALEACVGLNFFPGIEASRNMRDATIYAAAFRFDHLNAKVYAGFLTEVMAVPWQADFYDCRSRWWPSQRPDEAMLDATQVPNSRADWATPIADHLAMVENFARLGFVIPAAPGTVGPDTVFVERDRDPTFSR